MTLDGKTDGTGGRLSGKVALVTGAASGIGRESAGILAREGAVVVAADRDECGAAQTVKLIAAAGGEATYMAVDVSLPDGVRRVVAAVVDRYGRLDCAHNNAGVSGVIAPTIDYPLEEFDRVIAVNVRGIFMAMQAELAVMVDQGSGAIVNTSSTFGLVGEPNLSAYVAAKHAVAGLTKTAALEYARQGVRINAVCPGAIDTPMIDKLAEIASPGDPQAAKDLFAEAEPIGRLGRAAEIGEAVAWLCSDASSFATGSLLVVDGGWTAK